MNRLQLCAVLLLATLFTACQMPSPSGASIPVPSGGTSGGSSGSAGGSGGTSGGSTGSSGGSSGGTGGSSGGSAGGATASGGAGLPTPSGGNSGSSGSEQGDGGTSTANGSTADSAESGQTVGDLDGVLDESLDDFDDNVLGQDAGSKSDIDILNPAGGGSSAGISSDEPIFEEGDLGAPGGMVVEDSEIEQRASEGGGASGASGGGGAGAPGEQQTVASASSGNASGGEGDLIPIPDDVGDGQGDDIVLRQIRDAAEKEKDPVLREKLWDEYRRIKKQR